MKRLRPEPPTLLRSALNRTELHAPVERADTFRADATRRLNPKTRSALGQFMTPAPIARFMASLFPDPPFGTVRLLDPGCGVGALTAAFVEEFCRRGESIDITATAYEIDPILIDYASATLEECVYTCAEYGGSFTSNINTDDFIIDTTSILSDDLLGRAQEKVFYTHVITNPPYKKIGSSSDHRRQLRTIGIETSNLYTAFVAAAIKQLIPGGELVAIVPRSFCNGPYFRPFREFLLDETALQHVHVFESRTKAFKDDEVLQENIILRVTKGAAQGDVKISSSNGASFVVDEESNQITCEDMTQRVVPFESVVKPSDAEKFIHIAATGLDQQVVDRIASFDQTLAILDIEVSTGPVVDFRLKDDLRQDLDEGAVPLLYAQHFKGGTLEWPQSGRKPNAINVSEDSERWLMPNVGHYVVTRRFTSKEEKRRIVASNYDSSLPGELIGFENHLNVFHRRKAGLPAALAQGLSIYLNSSLVDRYFRQFNGHTQVNSTDLRSLRYPAKEILESFAKSASGNALTQQQIDRLVDEELNKMADDVTIDPILAQQNIDQALKIVKALGLPRGQHNDRTALTLLALLNIGATKTWAESECPLIGITPIMTFCRDSYGKDYAPNTRETFRRQTMHQFLEAGIVVYNPDDLGRAVNSPKACYQVSPEVFNAVVTYGTDKWNPMLAELLKGRQSLVDKYAKVREMQMIPVEVAPGQEIFLTPGIHSELIRDIIEEFAPRYAPGSEVIYVGDTGEKVGYFERDKLAQMGVVVDEHGKMPDVVLYFRDKDWLLLIESVTSHGPVDSKRHGELSKLFKDSKPGLVYVTAFPDRKVMGKYLSDISWETEVWVAKAPSHMIHFNGERFLGPYES